MRNSLFGAISAGINLIDALFESEVDTLDKVQRFMRDTLNENATRRSCNVLSYDNIVSRLPCKNLLSFRDDGEHLVGIFAVISPGNESARRLVQAVVDRLNQLAEIGEWDSRYQDGYFAITFCVRMNARPFDESVFTNLVNVVFVEIKSLMSLIPSSLLS